MGSKIKAGDWCLLRRAQGDSATHIVAQVRIVWNDGSLSANNEDWHPTRATKLPASPADMAKSHQLLLRWFRGGPIGNYERVAAMSEHIRRLTAKQSRRGGKGEK